MNLNPQSLNVVGAIGTTREIGKIELDLVPTLVESHGHCTYERLHAGGGLVIRSAESAADILVIQHLNLKGEVLLQILDDHHQERKLDTECLLRISRRCDVVGRHIGAHDFDHAGLDIRVCHALDVTIPHLLLPYLQRLGADGVEDRQEARLEWCS